MWNRPFSLWPREYFGKETKSIVMVHRDTQAFHRRAQASIRGSWPMAVSGSPRGHRV
jgi:hypothetical protein